MEAYIHLTLRSKYTEPDKARCICVDCTRFWTEAIEDASNMEDEAIVTVDELGVTKMYYGFEIQHARIVVEIMEEGEEIDF